MSVAKGENGVQRAPWQQHFVKGSVQPELGSRADIEAKLPLPHVPSLLDVSLTHPLASTYGTDAAAMQGSAAAKHDSVQYRGNDGHHHMGHTFIPVSIETYGSLEKPLVRYLNTLSEVAVVSKVLFWLELNEYSAWR